MRITTLVALALVVLACPGPGGSEPCTVTLVAGSADAADIQAYLDSADRMTLCLSGEFVVDRALSAAGKTNFALTAAPGAEAVLDFQGAGDPAGLALSGMTGLTVASLQIRDTKGHGLEIRDSAGVVLREVGVAWTAGADPGNGLFGLRVVASEDVLFEGCTASGAADAGILAIDSQRVIMRSNTATGNVTGLQVENTEHAHIHDNTATGNALGVFVVDLPSAPSGLGDVLVENNAISGNDGVNFAPDDLLAAAIPAGFGALVLATDTVEITGNTFEDNPSGAVLVVGFETVALLNPFEGTLDPGYDGYPETIDIHDNMMTNNGQMPADIFVDVFLMTQMPDLAWDGSVDVDKDNADGHLSLCIRNNGDADFVNLDALNLGAAKSTDLTPHDCSHPPVAPLDAPAI